MIRRTLACLAAAASVLVAGCTDRSVAPLSPPAAPAHDVDVDLSGLLQFLGTPNLTAPRHAEKLINAAEGGFVELQGFRVDIPAGALPANTVITIDLPSDALLAKRVLADFGPHGLQFNQPVTLSFPLTNVLLNGNPIQVVRWETDHWVGLGGWVSGTRLYGTTPHFSRYGGGYFMAGG